MASKNLSQRIKTFSKIKGKRKITTRFTVQGNKITIY
jgi:hypothetical protein